MDFSWPLRCIPYNGCITTRSFHPIASRWINCRNSNRYCCSTTAVGNRPYKRQKCSDRTSVENRIEFHRSREKSGRFGFKFVKVFNFEKFHSFVFKQASQTEMRSHLIGLVCLLLVDLAVSLDKARHCECQIQATKPPAQTQAEKPVESMIFGGKK